VVDLRVMIIDRAWSGARLNNTTIMDLEGYLTMLALRVTWPSFGSTTVLSFQKPQNVEFSALLAP
jgi:hypothetical protein